MSEKLPKSRSPAYGRLGWSGLLDYNNQRNALLSTVSILYQYFHILLDKFSVMIDCIYGNYIMKVQPYYDILHKTAYIRTLRFYVIRCVANNKNNYGSMPKGRKYTQNTQSV